MFHKDQDIELNQYIPQLINSLHHQTNANTFIDLEESVDRSFDQFMALSSTLNKTSRDEYKISWFVAVNELLDQLKSLKEGFNSVTSKHVMEDSADRIHMIKTRIGQLCIVVDELQLQLFATELNYLALADFWRCHQFVTVVKSLMVNSFSLSCNSFAADCNLLDHTELKLKAIGTFIKDVFVMARNNQYLASHMFSVLVQYLECIYYCGGSDLVSELSFLTPELPLSVDSDIKTISDYFVYNGLNLFDTGNFINADIYFKAYLSLPNSLPPLKDYELDRPPDLNLNPTLGIRSPGLIKRQEVALGFYLNRILMALDLESIMSSSKLVGNELRFLIRTFQADKSSSDRNDRHDKNPIGKNNQGPTAILYGPYDQQLSLVRVIQNLNELNIHYFSQCFSLDSDSDFVQSYNSQTGPGVKKFYLLVDTITKLLRLLALKFFIQSVGCNEFTETKLRGVLGPSTSIESILSVKPLLRYTIVEAEDKIYKFEIIEPELDEDSMVLHQLELSNQINELEGIYQENVFGRR